MTFIVSIVIPRYSRKSFNELWNPHSFLRNWSNVLLHFQHDLIIFITIEISTSQSPYTIYTQNLSRSRSHFKLSNWRRSDNLIHVANLKCLSHYRTELAIYNVRIVNHSNWILIPQFTERHSYHGVTSI